MAPKTRYPISLTPEERAELRELMESHKTPDRVALRAEIVLLADQGLNDPAIARRTGITPGRVGGWRKRFHAEKVAGLFDRPKSGRPRTSRPPRLDRDELLRQLAELEAEDRAAGRSPGDGRERDSGSGRQR